MTDSSRAAEFFNRFAGAFDSFYDGTRARFMRRLDHYFRADMYIRFERTFQALGDLSGKTVLDVGCGSGRYTLEALTRGARRVVALDPAPGMLAILRAMLAHSDYSHRCSVIESAFPTDGVDPCDYGIVIGVMDYVPDPLAFLRALRPLVKVSAVLSFPSRHWLRTPLRKLRYWVRDCPVFFYQAAQIGELARAAGFSRIDIYKIPGAGQDYHVCLCP